MSELLGIIVGALGGAAVGLEREWSGHARGPRARFAGLRTFTLIGGLGGLSGWMWVRDLEAPAVVVAGGSAALIVTAYGAASRRSIDATTETAALVVLAAGLMAGAGYLALASGTIALTALLLVEKSRLHAGVARIDDESLRAGLRFAVMAMVVLPLLPPGPYGPYDSIRPRELWMLVLFFSGLSFLGYVARRAVGSGHGDAVAGLLGGVVSSTWTTLAFARASRGVESSRSLGAGAVAACTVMIVRVLLAVAVLHLPLLWALLPYLMPPLAVGVTASYVGVLLRDTSGVEPAPPRNPLALGLALQMAILFQIVLLGMHVVRDYWGGAGLMVTGGLLGLSDMDAVTISMAHQASAGLVVTLAARATAVGAVANALTKLTIAVMVGRRGFRLVAGLGIAAIGMAGVLPLLLLR